MSSGHPMKRTASGRVEENERGLLSLARELIILYTRFVFALQATHSKDSQLGKD
jgi:hypothetical protein